MKVILLTDVKGTGKKNQVVNVNDGYARNFLIPKKMAMEATAGAVKVVDRRNEAERKKEAARRAEFTQIAEALKGKMVTVRAKCGDGDRLYGSITSQEIADCLEAQHGVKVDKRKIDLKDPIRTLGETTVTVRLYPEIAAEMKVKTVRAE